MKKIDWMVAAGTVAALAGAAYSAGCVNTASDCALLGTCVEGSGGGASTSSSTTATTGSTSVTSSDSSSSSSSSSGTGGLAVESACDAIGHGDMQDQAARSVLVGSSGDIVIAGDFHGSLSFGIKTANASSPGADELFVARLDSGQGVKFLQPYAVSYGAVARDPSGDIVLAGAYVNSADFKGICPALDNTNNFYVAKLDIDGNCKWARGFNFDDPSVHANLAVSASGHIALAGDAVGAMNFHDNAGGVLQLIGNNPGKRDIFAAELDAAGNLLTTVGFGGADDDVANGVGFSPSDEMVLTGAYKSMQIDFGSGLLKNVSGQDRAYVAGFGSAKSWSLGFSSMTGAQHPTALVTAGGLAVVAGDFAGTLGLLTAKPGGPAFFLLGVDAATGKLVWSHAFDGAGAKSVKALAASADGTLALTGALDGDIDFGGGPLASKGAVVATFKPDGTPISDLAFGDATSAPRADGVSFQGGSIFVAGAFASKLDFGNGVVIDSAGGTDVFVANLSQLCP